MFSTLATNTTVTVSAPPESYISHRNVLPVPRQVAHIHRCRPIVMFGIRNCCARCPVSCAMPAFPLPPFLAPTSDLPPLGGGSFPVTSPTPVFPVRCSCLRVRLPPSSPSPGECLSFSLSLLSSFSCSNIPALQILSAPYHSLPRFRCRFQCMSLFCCCPRLMFSGSNRTSASPYSRAHDCHCFFSLCLAPRPSYTPSPVAHDLKSLLWFPPTPHCWLRCFLVRIYLCRSYLPLKFFGSSSSPHVLSPAHCGAPPLHACYPVSKSPFSMRSSVCESPLGWLLSLSWLIPFRCSLQSMGAPAPWLVAPDVMRQRIEDFEELYEYRGCKHKEYKKCIRRTRGNMSVLILPSFPFCQHSYPS